VLTDNTNIYTILPKHCTVCCKQVHANKDQSAAAGGGKSAGNGWFNVVGSEQTAELKRDAELIRMRGYMDPKRFYKAPEVYTLITLTLYTLSFQYSSSSSSTYQ
jgi:Fcf2 pre-rRNA processing